MASVPVAIVCVGMAGELQHFSKFSLAKADSLCFLRLGKDYVHAKDQLPSALTA